METIKRQIAIIHRNDLNILFKYGYLITPPKEYRCNKNRDNIENNNITTLLENVSPIEYSSEYVFIDIPFRCHKVKYEDVTAIIPLDRTAKNDFESSFNKMIHFENPIWESYVEDYFQLLCCKDMDKGIDACYKILGVNKKNVPKGFLEDDLREKIVNYQFQKENLNSESSLCVYTLIYERYEPYPHTILGYFYDALHVFVNYTMKTCCSTMPPSHVLQVLKKMEMQNVSSFLELVKLLEMDEVAANYIEQNLINNVRMYIVLPLYFYLLRTIKDLHISALTEIKSEEWKKIRKKYIKEYALAVTLVGLKLKFSGVYEIYYFQIETERKSQKRII